MHVGHNFTAFIIMPFDPKFDSLLNDLIKPACRELSIIDTRLDEYEYVSNMHAKLYKEIKDADIIIAVMTDYNPNVYYEVGYARCLNKPIILLLEKGQDIPFDLSCYFHIFYDPKDLQKSYKKLASLLKSEIQNATDLILKPKWLINSCWQKFDSNKTEMGEIKFINEHYFTHTSKIRPGYISFNEYTIKDKDKIELKWSGMSSTTTGELLHKNEFSEKGHGNTFTWIKQN